MIRFHIKKLAEKNKIVIMNYGCKYYMSKQMLCLLLMFQTKRN